MRQAFARCVERLAAQDERVVVITGDLGFMVLEPFAARFPERFFNAGVAEQNMVGIATGLAEAGFIPFVYSIATFAVLRPYEFIRNGPVLHQLPVRIVGVGGGLEYGLNGVSHYGLEDVAVLRALPGLTIAVPADHAQATSAILATWDSPGPVYYRLGKDEHATVAGLDGTFGLDQIQVLRTGPDVVLIAMGPVAVDVVEAATRLEAHGVRCTVAIVAAVSPAPVEALAALLATASLAVTVEAHGITGGLGSLVAEVIASHARGCGLVRCGVETFPDVVASAQVLSDACGLSADALVRRVLKARDGVV